MHKHKEKSKAHSPWGAWSDWVWDETHGRHYRVRQDINGKYDYDWAEPQAMPRDMGHLARDFAHLSTADSSYEPQAGEYTVSSGADDKRSGKPKTKSSSKQGTQKRSDDPGIGSSRPGYADQRYEYTDVAANSYYPQSSGAADLDMRRGDPRTPSAYGATAPTYTMASQSNSHDPRGEEEMQAAVAASHAMYYGQGQRAGESSAAAYGAYYEEEDEGPPTPKPLVTGEDELLAEEMDPRYRVEHSAKFQPGEIFKVHWSEPQGTGNDYAPSVSGREEIQNKFGTKFYVGFRRFIVVASDLGHSTCVPILTYGGKGCKKRGVKPAKHGIIYERGHRPRLLDKEPPLGFPAVKVQMTEEGERLSKESRVNYSKLVTVEHNIKVFFIGTIVGDDWELVQDAVNQCWDQKNRHKKRR
ncbi:hypothetical protein JDV02_008290 [Purpureocillium takamizusanense]|uniref:DUF6590 domain-containing protein n=1 Tax=Purpureocillium takamizusanense TaxID=2060973 RepID=A0A9Q8VEZ2_9HYPO|nr:uncharacterized protein JDV02_008290 [Purpureocillium takamizusanense]UNI22399.1 hypothetical protein JDV02_008290 [Purpureocillium takamizusanense]